MSFGLTIVFSIFLILVTSIIVGSMMGDIKNWEFKDFKREFVTQHGVNLRIATLWCALNDTFRVQIELQRAREGEAVEVREKTLATANASVRYAKQAYLNACKIARREGYSVPTNHNEAEALARRLGFLPLSRGAGMTS